MASRSMRPLRTIAGAVIPVEYPLQARARYPALAGTAAGSHAGAGAVGGVGEVEQVGPFGVVELQGPGDGVQNGGGDAGDRAAFELGVVLDTDPGESGDLTSTQPGHPTGSDLGHPRLLRGDLGSPRDQKLADLSTVVHTVDGTAVLGRLGCPIGTRLDRDSQLGWESGLLGAADATNGLDMRPGRLTVSARG